MILLKNVLAERFENKNGLQKSLKKYLKIGLVFGGALVWPIHISEDGQLKIEITKAVAAVSNEILNVGFDVKPKSLDPRFIGADANSQYLEDLRFLPLVSFDEKGAPKFVVAEKIDPESPISYRIKIRKGIKFGNGKELTSTDVLATYETVSSGRGALPPSPRKGAFEGLKDLKKVNDYEILATLKTPDAAFVVNLVIGILPSEAQSQPPEMLIGKGYESGPFTLLSSSDTEIVLGANPTFSASVVQLSAPKMKKIAFKVIPDNTTRFAALIKGDIDVVQNSLDADKIVEIQKKYSAKFDVQTRPANNTSFIGFNFRDPQFSKPEVRRAIALGIDREEILKYILQGLGSKAKSMFPDSLPYHVELPDLVPNPKLAMEILDKVGLKDPDGKGPLPRFSFTLKVTTNKERISVAKALAAQLKRIGIEARVESLEFGTFNKQLADGLASAWVLSWTGYKDPDHLRYVFHSAQTPPIGGNRGRYSNAKVDKLLEAGQTTQAMDKRLPLYAEAQKLMSEELPYVYLWYKYSNAVVSKSVKGFKVYSDGRYASLVEVTKQ